MDPRRVLLTGKLLPRTERPPVVADGSSVRFSTPLRRRRPRERKRRRIRRASTVQGLMPPRAKLKAPSAAAPASGATLEHLPEILRALLSAENESRGVAEATLKALVREARGQCIAALLRHARGDADASVRQLAAVVLKRKVLAHWSTLSPQHQEDFKNALLEGVVREHIPAVRRAIADVVSKVAKATVPMGAWSALPEFLAQCAQSPEEGHREVAFVLFASLTETIVGTMTRHYATLGNLFQSGLADASLRVRVAALRAALALVANAPEKGSKDETEILRGLVLPVLAVARNAIAAGDERDAALAFEVLDELAEAQPRALAGRIEDVVAFCVEVAGTRGLDAVTRRRALDVVSFLARHKTKALCRAKVVPPLLRALCPLCGEPKESELAGEADVDDEDEQHVQTVAARLVDLLALNAPAKHVLPEVLAFASHAVSDANGDPRLRHAGVAVLGIVAEGCADGLERAMPQIVSPVVAALADASRDVRGAAAFALGQFAECVADATDFHEAVLPATFAALARETDARCLERVVYVLDAWLERLEENDVAPYVKPTLDVAYAAIDGAWAPKAREAVLGAVASAAAAAGTAMHAHLPSLLPRLEACLTASGDDDLRARARALEVLGMLISASGGAEAMAPHVPAAMAAAAAGFDPALDYSELREYGHGLFAETAEALEEGFAPYLEPCLEHARATLELDDGVVYDSEEERDEARRGGDPAADSDSDSDESALGAGINYSVFSGVVEEKAAACRAVASYAHFCSGAFAPFVPAFTPTLSAMADHMHDVVRAQAHAALARLAQCALRASPLPGSARPSPPDTSPAFDVVDASLNATHRALSEDDDRDAVCAAMEAAAEVIKSVARRDGVDIDAAGAAGAGAAGPGAARLHAGKHVEGLAALCLRVLEGRAVCQENVDDDLDFQSGEASRETPDDEDEDEEAELGVVVLEGCAELLPALVTVAGANAAAAFEPHFTALARRVGPSRPEGQRSVAYATLVEMVKALGASPAVARVAPAALAGCVAEIGGADAAGLRRNCAYCAGVLAELGGAAVAGQREALVAALCGLLAREGADGRWVEKDAGTRDNAAGAAARVLFAADGAVARDPRLGPPLMDALLAGVPLVEDFEECAAAYELGLAGLAHLAAEVPAARERIGDVVAAAARVVAAAARADAAGSRARKDEKVAKDSKTGPTREMLSAVAASVAKLHALDATAVDAAVAGLPEDQRTALASLAAGF